MKKYKKFEEFNSALQKFNDKIADAFPYSEETYYPIFDGPLNPKEYFHSKIKIVWILKEAYVDNEENKESAIHYSDLLKEYWSYEDFLKLKFKTTWHPIVYTTYGILNKINYDKMPYIREDNSLGECLHKIAIININKYPAVQRQQTDMLNLFNLFKRHGLKIFAEQIELLEPNVIIFGYTMETVNHFLQIIKPEFQIPTPTYKMTRVYKKDDILFFDSYHPSARKNKEIYCDEIIYAVEKYLND